jgi:aryl-alcohol dehydrogenase-like predicted oxidoreductase
MEYRWLGTTGVKVSTLALGTMGFGGAATGGWVGTIDLDDATRQVRMALDAGVNLFDTANGYSKGASEELLGRALGSARDGVLVSTKAHVRVGEGVNDVGQSRWHLLRACEASLRRLGTDHIDVYHVHGFDGCTPMEETLRALDDLVRQGKVRYLACSNYAAWHIVKALAISRAEHLEHFVAVQAYYSLVARELEWDILPACRDQGVGVLVWSPLAGGFLSGKFRRDADAPADSRRGMIGDLGVGTIDEERGFAVIDVARSIADRRGVSVAQVALNWLRTRAEVSSVIVGARTDAQLADNLAAATWALDAEETARLDQVSAVPWPYPQWFHRQFTAERFSREGPPAEAFAYDFPVES